MAIDITQVLLSLQSSSPKIRHDAEKNLKQFQNQNLPLFLLSLAVELSNDRKPHGSRNLAGIILKNSVFAKDPIRKKKLALQWVNTDPLIKAQIKESLFKTLRSPVRTARTTSSIVIACIASIEIPRKEWPELVGRLLSDMTQPDTSANLKQATFTTLEYLCEMISPQDLEQDQVNSILTVVVQVMTQMEHSSEVCLAAIRSLRNVLDFARANFENEVERGLIVMFLCETAMSEKLQIREAAFQCLVSIASTYYVLEPYIQMLFNLTSSAVERDEESIALQAIEIWSSICEKEIEIQEDHLRADIDVSAHLHSHIIEKTLHLLVPMLLGTLLEQEEGLDDQDEDDEEWNLSMAGQNCLSLIARTVRDAVIPLVMPFVEDNITNNDWHKRGAATCAFGSILEGPSIQRLSPFVHGGLDFLLSAMKDENTYVRKTTACTLCKIFEFQHYPNSEYPLVTIANLPHIISVLLESINDVPCVAEKVYVALYFLAQGYKHSESNSSVFLPYLFDIFSALLSATDCIRSRNSNLWSCAYDALNELVRCSKLPETSNVISQLLHVIMTRLHQTLVLQINSFADRERQSNLQALHCGVLQEIVKKLNACNETKPMIFQFADRMMFVLLRVFASSKSTMHEAAMLVSGALARATGPEFAKYMPEFYKYLEMGLQNFREYQVCSISVRVVGDICCALHERVLPYSDGIMAHLHKALSNSTLDGSVKPCLIACIGYIAYAIGLHFEKHLPYLMPKLQAAAELCVKLDVNDEDMLEYRNQFMRGILEAYSGMLKGFVNFRPELMMPYAGCLLQFIEAIFKDGKRDEELTTAALGVMGRLAFTLGPEAKTFYKEHAFYNDFLKECFQSNKKQPKQAATWAQGMIIRSLAL